MGAYELEKKRVCYTTRLDAFSLKMQVTPRPPLLPRVLLVAASMQVNAAGVTKELQLIQAFEICITASIKGHNIVVDPNSSPLCCQECPCKSIHCSRWQVPECSGRERLVTSSSTTLSLTPTLLFSAVKSVPAKASTVPDGKFLNVQ